MRRDFTSLALIVADNSTAALKFNDRRVAGELLAALHARQHILSACIYDLHGDVLASYVRPAGGRACPRPAAGEEFLIGNDSLTVSHPVMLDGDRIGTVVLLADLDAITERTRVYGGIVLASLLASSLMAFLLSSRLRAMVSAPISKLAQAATSISSGDYSVRVPKESNDELGVLVGAFNRMAERVQSRETDLENARNLLQTTLASIGDAVISSDVSGRIVFANAVALSLMRWPEAEIGGRPIETVFRIVNEYSRQTVENPVERVLREDKVVGLENHTVLIARDGTEIPIDDSAAPIRLNGRVIGVVLVFRDVTERRKAQQDSGYLAAIVESSDDAIIGKSAEGIIQTWNAAAERLYGYTAEEIIGRPMTTLAPPDRLHEESDILERMRDGMRVVHFETLRQRKDGTIIDVSLTVSPIRDKTGKIVGISHVARDITEQKRHEEQMRQTQKLESLGILAGGIAHDFNNLLTGIMGNASLALDEVDAAAPAAERMQDVITASERAAQLARQMLAYSGKGRFILERIDLSARLRETLPLIRAAIPPTVELRLDLSDNLPCVEADSAQIQQLMMNIIINGAEAVPEGLPGIVTIATRRQYVNEEYLGRSEMDGTESLRTGDYVLLEVRDTGSGMDANTKARIFDPFFTTKFTGRGLGLAAVLGIVRGHSGSIDVQTAPGEGTVFRVLLPALPAARPTEPAPEEKSVSDLRGGGVVLVIDDELVVRRMARQALERYGYRVLVAEDGSRGLEMFRLESGNIDCIVLDLTMPVMSGEETLACIKAVRPNAIVILSSGFNEAQAVRRFQGKGLAGFLQKPYKATALLELVKAVIARSAGGHRARA